MRVLLRFFGRDSRLWAVDVGKPGLQHFLVCCFAAAARHGPLYKLQLTL